MNATVEPRISDVFAEALEAERETLNAKFAEHRVAGHQIDPEAFGEHLAAAVDPLVCQIGETLPERVRVVVKELYSTSLDLFAAALLGSTAKVAEIAEVWHRLLPVIPRLVARDPARVVGCLCNAVYNVAAQAETRPNAWIDGMIQVGEKCDDTKTLLDCGRVLSWQAGMVQYRPAALATARELPKELTTELLDLPSDTTTDKLGSLLDRLEADPWSTPATVQSNAADPPLIRCVRTVGAFRGFGGLFMTPPRVDLANGRFFVSDDEAQWELLADASGVLFHRVTPTDFAKKAMLDGPKIDADGTVSWSGVSAAFPELAAASSSAFDGTTLAVTLPTSHHVYMLACR